MELFLCLIVFSQVREVVTELIELVDKLIKNCLLAINVVQEPKESLLDIRPPCKHLFTHQPKVFEYFLHLLLVVC
jgi:hypothetical protein